MPTHRLRLPKTGGIVSCSLLLLLCGELGLPRSVCGSPLQFEFEVGSDGAAAAEEGGGGGGGTAAVLKRRHLLSPSDLDPDEQVAQKALEFHVMMKMYSSCANYSIASYSRKAGWGSPQLTHWYGLSLDQDEFVTAIDLTSSRLRCAIPSELGNLLFLESLVLSNNEFTGTVPTELGKLTNLHTLNLMKQKRKLVGSIPEELGQLTNLRYLDLSYNSITMPIPSSIGSLARLEVLELSNNFINGTFPDSLRNLRRLEVLNMKHNAITSDVAHLYDLLPQFEADTTNTQFWMSNIFNAGGEQSALFQKNDV